MYFWGLDPGLAYIRLYLPFQAQIIVFYLNIFGLGARPGGSQSLRLALCSVTILDRLGGPSGVLGIKLGSDMYKASALYLLRTLFPQFMF